MIEKIVLKRPKTVLQQYKDAVSKTSADWLLILDDDITLLKQPDQNFRSEYDLLSFKWFNAPKVFGRDHYGQGLYRVSALREILANPNLVSEGLDLLLCETLNTRLSEEFGYTHSEKFNLKQLFRYGKGRAFYIRIVKPKKRLPDLKNLKIRFLPWYFAYALGFFYGLFCQLRDNNW